LDQQFEDERSQRHSKAEDERSQLSPTATLLRKERLEGGAKASSLATAADGQAGGQGGVPRKGVRQTNASSGGRENGGASRCRSDSGGARAVSMPLTSFQRRQKLMNIEELEAASLEARVESKHGILLWTEVACCSVRFLCHVGSFGVYPDCRFIRSNHPKHGCMI